MKISEKDLKELLAFAMVDMVELIEDGGYDESDIESRIDMLIAGACARGVINDS